MWIKRNVVMLPTDEKASIIGLYKDTKQLVFNNPNNKDIPRGIPQHLYILSDEEIKEGDWIYRFNSKDVFKADSFLIHLIERNSTEICKKIIATTDSFLNIWILNHNGLSEGEYQTTLPQPSQQFIEKYVEEYNKDCKTKKNMEKSIEILKKFEQQEWITKDKQKIKIKDLSISHLGNIYKNLKKKFDSLEDPMNDYPSFQGEMAQMYAEQQWEASNNYYRQLERNLQLFEVYYKLKTL